MASASSAFALLGSSSSACFAGSKVTVKEPSYTPTRVQFRPLRVSAGCSSTAERTVSPVASPSSLYEVLGIRTGATFKEIKVAYRRLARVLHPDVSSNGENNPTGLDFIKLHEAYATLSDPEKRADYDRTLLFRARRSFVTSSGSTASMANGFSGYTRRNWESDQCW